MRISWTDYTQLHRVSQEEAHRLYNVVRYWLENRGVRLTIDEPHYTDHEWTGAVEMARLWWGELVAGTFADW